jgi:uncharacterized repeat protein (TIGR02543 family)
LTSIILAAFAPLTGRAQEVGIDIKKQGTGVQLTWSGGILQSASTPAGPWSPVAGAVSPHNIAGLQGKGFFRVQRAYTLTLAKAGSGSGTVRSTALAMVCGAECSRLIPAGTTVTLEAIPDAGSTFAGWTGDGTGTGARQVTIDGAKSVTATFTPVMSSNPIVNGGFELGALSGWQQQPGQLIYTGAELGITPHSGQYVARLGFDQDDRILARIGQQITLPSSGPIYLNFALWLYSDELCDVPYYDNFTIYVGGEVLAYNDRLCQGGGTNGWQLYSYDLSALAGQSVAIVFSISSADTLTSIALLDDIAISNQPWQ